MSQLNHSEETHAELLARVPSHTGRSLAEWFAAVDAGPSLSRFEDRVNWLRAEHDLPHGYATAIIHEHDKLRAAHRTG